MATLLYVCVGNKNGGYDWHSIDPITNIHKFEVKMHGEKFPYSSFSCAALGSKLFVVGGYYCDGYEFSDEPTNKVNVFDTKLKTWKQDEPMKVARVDPILISFKDKLYVFGSWPNELDYFSKLPWVECYYDGKWHSDLSTPPSEVINCERILGHTIDSNSGRFIFWNMNHFYLYDVRDDLWHSVPFNLNFIPGNYRWTMSTKVGSVGNYLYWYYYGDVFAYDPTRKSEECYYPIIHLQDSTVPSYSSRDNEYRAPSVVAKFPSYSSCDDEFLAPFVVAVDENRLCLVWYSHLCKFCSWLTLEIQGTKVTFDLTYRSNFSASAGTGIFHCIAVKQHINEENNLGENLQVTDAKSLLENFSRCMYAKSYISYVVGSENRGRVANAAKTLLDSCCKKPSNKVRLYKDQITAMEHELKAQIAMSEYKSISTCLSDHELKLKHLSKENHKLRAEFDRVKSENEDLTLELLEDRDYGVLDMRFDHEKYRTVHSELDLLRSKNEELKLKLKNKRQAYRVLHRNSESDYEELQTARIELDQLKHENDGIAVELSVINRDYVVLNSKADAYFVDLQTAYKELGALKSENILFLRDLEDLTIEYNYLKMSSERDYDSYCSTVNRQKKEHEKLELKMRDKDRKYDVLNKRLGDSRNENLLVQQQILFCTLKEKESELKEMQEKIFQLTAAYEEVQQSIP